MPGRAAELELAHATPLPELLELVLADGRVTVCTQCAVRRGITAADVLPGVRIAGAPVFVEEILAEGAQTTAAISGVPAAATHARSAAATLIDAALGDATPAVV